MAITGTGTQADPYTFDPSSMTASEVWTDFKTILAKGSSEYASLPTNYILDMNDVEPEINYTIPWTTGNLIGNNFRIRNLHSIANTIFNTNYKHQNIYDIHFENVYAERLFTLAATGSLPVDYRTRFYGVTVTGYFSTTDNVIGYIPSPGGGTLQTTIEMQISSYTNKGCGFNIQAPNGSLMNVGYYTSNINSSLFIFEGKSLTYPGTSNGTTINERGDALNVTNCKITGEMNNLIVYSGKNNIIDTEVSNSFVGYSGVSMTVYNNLKATPTFGSDYLIGVNEAQLKNARYLSNLGFPIGVD